MKRKFLEDLGLEKEVIDKILDENMTDVGRVKTELDATKESLAEAQSTLETLQKSNQDNETLQKEIQSYQTKIADLEAQALQTAMQHTAENALREAGVKDISYGLFKLGNLEADEKGGVKDLENKIKEFKESSPDHFHSQNQDENPLDGFKPIGNGLKQGSEPELNDVDAMIAAMTADIK